MLGSDPEPHILSTKIFSVWWTELTLEPMLCLDKEKKAAGLHIQTIDSLNWYNTLDRVGAVLIPQATRLRFPSAQPDYKHSEL